MGQQLFKNFLQTKYALYSVFGLWAVVQVFFLMSGIKVSVDSEVYIIEAKEILQGHSLTGISFWHSGYSFFLAGIFYLGGGLEVVILCQLLLAALSLLLLVKLVRRITSDEMTAIAVAFLYVLWLKIHEWNSFIYTESLFTSLILISFYLLTVARRWWQYFFLIPLFVFTALIRPTGIGFVAALMAYAGYHAFMYLKIDRLRFSFIVLAIGLCFLWVLNFILADYVDSILQSYAQAEIIYPKINLWISVPDDVWLPSANMSPLSKLFFFALYNPWYFAKLTMLKGLLFISNVKPYFSLFHNLVIVVVLYLLYVFAIMGIKQLRASAEKWFMLVFILVQILTVSLTSENWDGRFLIPVLPIVFIFSGIGLINWLKRIRPALFY